MTTPERPDANEIEKQLIAARCVARDVQAVRTGIVLTGYVRDGKVELDQATLDEIAKQFAGANTAFVAVNAPFDPKSVVE